VWELVVGSLEDVGEEVEVGLVGAGLCWLVEVWNQGSASAGAIGADGDWVADGGNVVLE